MYLQFQILQQQMEQINQNLEILNQQHAELDSSKNAVVEIRKIKIDNEILVPVANGIFIKAKLSDNNDLVVNVGANTTVTKDIEQVVGMLDKHQKEISTQIVEMEQLLQELQAEAMKIYKTIEDK